MWLTFCHLTTTALLRAIGNRPAVVVGTIIVGNIVVCIAATVVMAFTSPICGLRWEIRGFVCSCTLVVGGGADRGFGVHCLSRLNPQVLFISETC